MFMEMCYQFSRIKYCAAEEDKDETNYKRRYSIRFSRCRSGKGTHRDGSHIIIKDRVCVRRCADRD